MGTKNRYEAIRRARSVWGLLLAMTLFSVAAAGPAHAIDFCACEGSDSQGDFDVSDPATHPPGIVFNQDTCTPVFSIPVPESGTLVFDSFRVLPVSIGCGNRPVTVNFIRNEANSPVTILVKNDFTIESSGTVSVSAGGGSNGSVGAAGVGGQGGPGGFAGGDGAYRQVTFTSTGGAGVGPGGGDGGVADPLTPGEGGTFVGVPELRPLLGGSGGGGGHSSADAAGCSGGGGGGGGGALLVAANETITVNGTLVADGGGGGRRSDTGGGGCSSEGSGGSGGAIRLIANVIQGSGSIFARGGGVPGFSGSERGSAGSGGRVRLEGITNTFRVDGTNPIAIRAPAPGPLQNPVTPTVRITAIDGIATPDNPIGHRGQVDPQLILPAPGVVQIDLRSTDVPAGTDLEVTVKPKVGALPVSQRVTLTPGACNAGVCVTATSFDLAAGAYIVEARATFETP